MHRKLTNPTGFLILIKNTVKLGVKLLHPSWIETSILLSGKNCYLKAATEKPLSLSCTVLKRSFGAAYKHENIFQHKHMTALISACCQTLISSTFPGKLWHSGPLLSWSCLAFLTCDSYKSELKCDTSWVGKNIFLFMLILPFLKQIKGWCKKQWKHKDC